MIYFFIILGVVALGGILAICSRQLAYVRANSLVDLSEGDEYLWELFQCRVDSFYDQFALFFKRLIHNVSLLTLITLRRIIVISRFILTRIERRFSRLIDAVHGRTVLLNRGAASPFLTQIKDHKEAALANFKAGK